MATNHTEHYQLNQWEATDRVLRTDFNEDNAKLDAALNELREKKGNCQIVTGSYVGTGTKGKDGPNTLVFDRPVVALFVLGGWRFWGLRGIDWTAAYHNGESSSYSRHISLSWSESTVSWYGDLAEWQCNTAGATYRYLALVAME